MVELRYFAPAPPLRGLISSYYWCASSLPMIADRMRAELGQVRVVVTGKLVYSYADGRSLECPDVLLSGPTTTPVTTQGFGPFAVFGAGLMPSGWSALIGIDADELGDETIDFGGVVGSQAESFHEAMGNATSDAMRVGIADRFFLALLERARPVPLWFTALADDWLTATPDPQVDTLVAATGMSQRQVERWVRRHYGASPKLLARKYRTLQAAVRLGNGDAGGWSDAAGDAFYDQSHFIREFRQFIGLTPSRFLADAAPISRVSIARRRLLPGMPKLALYS